MRLTGAILLIQLWSVAQAAELQGVVQWAQRVELGTPVSGMVVAVPAKAGLRVNKGELLVQLETRSFQAGVKKAEAEVASLKREREEAQRELERSKELYDRTLLSNHDLEQAKIAYAKSNSRYQSASAALVDARLELEQSAIRAPFDGVVLEQNAAVGQSIVSALQSAPLVTIASTQQMVIVAEATQLGLKNLALKQSVDVEVDGQRFKGMLTFIGFEPLNTSGEPRYPLQVKFSPDDSVIRVGQPAKVIVP